MDYDVLRQYTKYYGSGAYDRRYPHANHFTLESILERVHSKSAPTILDFGCGSGRYTAPLASHCKTIVAYDPCSEAINLLKKRSQLPNIIPSQDVEQVLRAGPYDIVICIFGVLSHTPERQIRLDILRFLHKCLAADGVLFVSVPNRLRRFYKEQLTSAFKGDFSGIIYYRRPFMDQLIPYCLYTPASLRSELEECKFSIESIKPESLLPEKYVTNSDHTLSIERNLMKIMPRWLGYGLLAEARVKD